MNKIVSDLVEHVEKLEATIEAYSHAIEKKNQAIDKLEDLVHELDQEKNRLLVENVLLKAMLKAGEES